MRQRGWYEAPSEVVGGVIELSFPLFSGEAGVVGALASPYLRQRDVRVNLADARAALRDAEAMQDNDRVIDAIRMAIRSLR